MPSVKRQFSNSTRYAVRLRDDVLGNGKVAPFEFDITGRRGDLDWLGRQLIVELHKTTGQDAKLSVSWWLTPNTSAYYCTIYLVQDNQKQALGQAKFERK